MSARDFRSLGKPKLARKVWSEAEIVAIARQLLNEHAASREAATKAANLVCGVCKGACFVPSTLMPGETLACYACEGTGKPNDKAVNLPALGPEDHERIWKIGQLLKGPHRFAVLQVIKEAMPDMYSSAEVMGTSPN